MLDHYELIGIEIAVRFTIRQLLFHFDSSCEVEAPGHAGVFLGEPLIKVPNNKLCTRHWQVSYQVLLGRQITVAVSLGFQIWAIIRQVGKQV